MTISSIAFDIGRSPSSGTRTAGVDPSDEPAGHRDIGDVAAIGQLTQHRPIPSSNRPRDPPGPILRAPTDRQGGTMKYFLSIAILALASAAQAAAPKPTIILVHGAFADASSWSKIIPILEHDGYSVTAVQIPLTSLADDIATTKRALASHKGPMVLVGHSYGGAVITGAAAGNP